MGRKIDLEDMRGKDPRELEYDLAETRKALFNARLQMGESVKSVDVRGLKRRIARLITILQERRVAAETAVPAAGGSDS